MQPNFRMLAAAVVLAGAAGALTQGAAPAGKPAPIPAPVVQKAARAVLHGVGIESGLTRARVDNALSALEDRVERQSDPAALRLAFQAYFSYQAAHPEKVRKPYLYFVDYGLDNRTPRGYVFDMEALKVVDGPFTVAHGRGSASRSSGVPTRFSNREGSNATSLGLYVAQETYQFRGKSGGVRYSSLGLRLDGVSGEYNSAARRRGVVVHGAPYVTANRAGRSEGCPAMEQSRARKLIPMIAGGGMVFLFSPLDRTWMQKDRWATLSSAGQARG